jgi:hypothetical protein
MMATPRHYLVALLAMDGVLIGSFIVAAGWHVPFQEFFVKQLNPNDEANLATWYASSKLFMAALMMAVLTNKQAWRQPAAVVLTLLLVGLSMEETAQFHERIGAEISTRVTRHGIVLGTPSQHDWPYLYGLPALLLVIASLWWIRKDSLFTPLIWMRFILGFGVLLLGAVGLEILSHVIRGSVEIGPTPVISLIEEMIELIGGSLLVWAAAHALSRRPNVAPADIS